MHFPDCIGIVMQIDLGDKRQKFVAIFFSKDPKVGIE